MKCINLPTVLAAFLLLISSATGFTNSNHKRRIKKQFDVSLQTYGIHFCGGSLIAANIVLTAAHCFYDEGKLVRDPPFTVVAGTLRVDHRTHSSLVTKIYSHRGFRKLDNGQMVNDIAVLSLKHSFYVKGNLPIRLALLPLKNEDFSRKIPVVSGYGKDGTTLERRLRRKLVNLVEPEKCGAERYPNLLCGQTLQSHGVCDGDSGSPLTIDKKVIGIVSSSPIGCDESREPATYTKVSEFLDFIQNVIINRQTNDMSVQSFDCVYYHISFLKMKKTACLPAHISKLNDIQKLASTAEYKFRKLNELKESANRLKSECKRLLDKKLINEYNAQYEEYTIKYQEHKALLPEFRKLQTLIHNKVSDFIADVNKSYKV